MTRTQKLTAVLNVRVDDQLATEIRRIATAHGQTDSEVARNLLHYGALVQRQLEIQQLGHHYAYEERRPGYVDVQARFVPDTDGPQG